VVGVRNDDTQRPRAPRRLHAGAPAAPDVVDVAVAARILSCAPDEVAGLLAKRDWPNGRKWTRTGVEEVALSRWRLAHSRGPDSYWVTRAQACSILGVNRSRVGQLVEAGLVPYERARTVRRQIVFRREQLQVVAHARRTRYATTPNPETGEPH
jgi:hypothetical protein